MSRIAGHAALGVRWLHCGWRMCLRNPWLLLPMGLTAAVVFSLLSFIPLFGVYLVALVTPIFFASSMMTIDVLAGQKMSLPPALRKAALVQAPRALIGVLRDERRIIPMVLVCLYVMVIVAFTNILAWKIAGRAWAVSWWTLGVLEMLLVFVVAAAVAALFFAVATTLVYALPLMLLQQEPLFPAIARSVPRAWHYAVALLTVFALLLVPSILRDIIAAVFAPWIGYAVALLVNAIGLAVVTASLYCSYRMIFPPQKAR